MDDFFQGELHDIEHHGFESLIGVRIPGLQSVLKTCPQRPWKFWPWSFLVPCPYGIRPLQELGLSSRHGDRPALRQSSSMSRDGCLTMDSELISLVWSSTSLVLAARFLWAFCMAVAAKNLLWNAEGVSTSILSKLCGISVSYDGESVTVLCMMHSGSLSAAAKSNFAMHVGHRFPLSRFTTAKPSDNLDCSLVQRAYSILD